MKLHPQHLAIAATLALLPLSASADEGGVPFWFSGQFASFAAVPATPGWSLPIQGYYYSGDASKSKSLSQGDSVTLGLDSRSPLLMAQPSYAPQTKLFGAQASIGLGFGFGSNTTGAKLKNSPECSTTGSVVFAGSEQLRPFRAVDKAVSW